MRPSGDTARGLVFDDFVDKQVVHVSATSFRSGAELVSMLAIYKLVLPNIAMCHNVSTIKLVTFANKVVHNILNSYHV